MPSLSALLDLIHTFDVSVIEMFREVIEALEGIDEDERQAIIAVLIAICRLRPEDRVAIYPRYPDA